MLKVLLVDDEYVITQGLSVLIDWGAEGYGNHQIDRILPLSVLTVRTRWTICGKILSIW